MAIPALGVMPRLTRPTMRLRAPVDSTLGLEPRSHGAGRSPDARTPDRPRFDIIAINDLTGPVMAGSLHVRNLDDELIARLKRRAARHGRSAEAEHREILRQALAAEDEPSFETLAADLRKLTRRRKQTPSEVLLREGRDER
jgi:plasmid stability protein